MRSYRMAKTLSCAMVLISALLGLASCDGMSDRERTVQRLLLDAARPGASTRISEVLPYASDAYVCALGPYQDSTLDTSPQARRIDRHLQETDYIADESHWLLVIALPDRIDLFRLQRSVKLDFDSGGRVLRANTGSRQTSDFNAAHCAPYREAAFVWSDREGRVYATFGAMAG